MNRFGKHNQLAPGATDVSPTPASPAAHCTPGFPLTFDATGNWTSALFAVSVAGVVPTGCVTWFQAAQACALSGKPLPTSRSLCSAGPIREWAREEVDR